MREPIRDTAYIRMAYANLNPTGHWFDPDTLRWWGSRIGRNAYPTPTGALFVTSEFTGFERVNRAYTVRRFDRTTGEIDTVGEFLGHATNAQATRAAREIARTERESR